jgi:hypothetical protein
MFNEVKTLYKRLLCDFFEEIKDKDVKNMPLIHLPIIGNKYEDSQIRIAIYGKDTDNYRRNELKKFQESYNKCKSCENIYDDLVDQSKTTMKFVEWANEYNFFGFIFKFLAEINKLGWQNWEKIKTKECSNIVQSFIWGNTNSFEIDKRKSEKYHADRKSWEEIKDISKKYFDGKIKNIIEICKPDLLLILNSEFKLKKTLGVEIPNNEDKNNYIPNQCAKEYLDNECIKKEQYDDIINHFYHFSFIRKDNKITHIYRIAHPHFYHDKNRSIKFILPINMVLKDFHGRR